MKSIFICLMVFVSSYVYSQWSTNPFENLEIASHGGNIHVVPDGNGGAVITFNNFDYKVVTTYLQWVDKFGYLKWIEPKIIANSPGPRNFVRDIFHNADGTILTGYVSGYDYIDTNLVQHYIYDPYVQKIDSNGSKIWGEDGIRLKADSTGKDIAGRDFCYDGNGGVFGFWDFVFNNNNSTYKDSLFLQHISEDGKRLWGEQGILVFERISADFGIYDIRVIPDDSGGVFLNYLGLIEKYNSDGILQWSINDQNYWELIKDGQGGIIGSWVKTISPRQLRINRISSVGEKLWGEEGIIVDDSVGANYAYALLLLNQDNTVSVFWDTEWWPNDDVFLQHYTLEGVQIWEEHLKISEIVSPKVNDGIINSDNNSNIIIWRERRDSAGVYAQKIDVTGIKIWNEDVLFQVMSYGTGYDELNVITDGNDGAIIVWRIDPPWGGIYAQQISKYGNLGEVITSVKEDDYSKPLNFYLAQNYPNPFNPNTVISYQLPVNGYITLKVYDILGNEVATLVNEEKQPGVYEVEFSAKSGQESGIWNLASGIYFYQLKAGSFSDTKKMILLR